MAAAGLQVENARHIPPQDPSGGMFFLSNPFLFRGVAGGMMDHGASPNHVEIVSPRPFEDGGEEPSIQ